jgi:YHS domain-containing protein
MTLWILRIILLLLVIRLLWRLVAGVLEGLRELPPDRDEPVRLVRDPVCGTFILPSRALEARRGGKVAYVCSARCRDTYEAG